MPSSHAVAPDWSITALLLLIKSSSKYSLNRAGRKLKQICLLFDNFQIILLKCAIHLDGNQNSVNESSNDPIMYTFGRSEIHNFICEKCNVVALTSAPSDKTGPSCLTMLTHQKKIITQYNIRSQRSKKT